MFRSQVEKTYGKNWIRYQEAGWFQGITNLTRQDRFSFPMPVTDNPS